MYIYTYISYIYDIYDIDDIYMTFIHIYDYIYTHI